MRRVPRILLAATAAASLFLGACRDYRFEELAPLPPRVEARGPEHLRVEVTDMAKRAVPASELPQFQRAGFRWDYAVRFTETGGVGVRLERLENQLRSQTGVTSTESITLPSRVEPKGSTPITVRAVLTTSDPGQPGNLRGIQTLTFRGRDDRGQPVEVVVRVPLE
ncbi:MAG: hypothetical protein ACE147_18775 [Candidatus Methylomirabilales bacterium]